MSLATIKVEVKLNKFPDIGSRQHMELSRAIRKTAEDIVFYAGNVVPVDTSNLKNSIQASQDGNDLQWKVAVGAEYGIYVEYGTRSMSERPYMRLAVEQVRDAFTEACKQAIQTED